jgi:hypothetical protein
MAEAANTLRHTPDATTLPTWLDETRAGLDAAMRSAGESCSPTGAELRVPQAA